MYKQNSSLMVCWFSCFLYSILLVKRSYATAETVNSLNCSSDIKIYVYDIPASLLEKAETARKKGDFHICKKCIYEQFSLEYIVFDHFMQHCGRTYDPAEADFFYLPIIREIDYRIALSSGGQRAPSIIEEVLLEVIEKNEFTKWHQVFNITDKYWRRGNGSDHIVVMPAPVTNLRHQTNMRGFFHYMIQLNSPIFLNVEFSRSFVEEYPVCAAEKNIIMPYPTVDSDFYSGKLFAPSLKRDKLLFYLGGNHGSCVHIRDALTSLSRNKQYAIQRGPKKREEGFQSAVFCPIPIGDSPSSKRMYDVINFGCIPVVLSDDLVWAYSTDSGGPLDPASFSLQLPQSVVQKSAEYVLSRANAGGGSGGGGSKGATEGGAVLINGGKALPSGVTLYSILQLIVEEDRLAALLPPPANSTSTLSMQSSSSNGGNVERPQQHGGAPGGPKRGKGGKQQQRNNRSRRLLGAVATASSVKDIRTSVDDKMNLKHNGQSNLQTPHLGHIDHHQQHANKHKNIKTKNSANRMPASSESAASPNRVLLQSEVNTLIRVLEKVSAEDIRALQAGVRNVSKYFQFYPIDPATRTDLTPPAYHMPPSGHAMRMLDQLLSKRKKEGIWDINRRCQAERSRVGHKYIGRYPCEKRRRLRRKTRLLLGSTHAANSYNNTANSYIHGMTGAIDSMRTRRVGDTDSADADRDLEDDESGFEQHEYEFEWVCDAQKQ